MATNKHSGMDSRNNAVVVNDKVQILTGLLKGQTATVLHIRHNSAFLRVFDKIHERDQGIRCEMMRNLLLKGAAEF